MADATLRPFDHFVPLAFLMDLPELRSFLVELCWPMMMFFLMVRRSLTTPERTGL